MIKLEHVVLASPEQMEVSWEKKRKCYRKTKNGRYEAYVSDHCRFISLGTYDNKDDAIIAVEQYKDYRLRAAVQSFGHEPEDGIIYEEKVTIDWPKS